MVEDQTSPFFGKRMVVGWRLENLPWTYEMSQKRIYQRDLKSLNNKWLTNTVYTPRSYSMN